MADTVNKLWRCCWCDTLTLGRITRREAHPSRLFTTEQLRGIHARYACGESLRALATAHHTHQQTLKLNFWALGLPTRTLAAACALTATQREPIRLTRRDNATFRPDVTDESVIDAYRRTGSIRRTASELGVSGCMVRDRLISAGHPLRPWGANQHTRSAA